MSHFLIGYAICSLPKFTSIVNPNFERKKIVLRRITYFQMVIGLIYK